MQNKMKRSLAAMLCVSMCAVSLSACSKKSEELDTTKALITLESGASMDTATANTILRYEQAAFENGIGMLYSYYYGLTDIWNTDLYGTGEAYSETFKGEQLEVMERMLLCEEHMEELGIEITDEEAAAISEAAAQFISDNEAYTDALSAMSATQESVENMLRYYTIQSKAEVAMGADVDTEVSDEEAAQRTVYYYRVNAVVETEEETEAVSEEVTEQMSEAAESVVEAAAQIGETETEARTQSAGETEDLESVAESTGEVSTEAEEETEGETESAEMIEARQIALAAAEEFFAQAQSAEDAESFEAQADAAAEENSNVYASSLTFGDDDTYPDAAIIEATKDLEDNTLVEEIIVVDSYYYVLYVEDAFDEEATADRKDEIVEERREEAVEAQYTEWTEAEEITVDEDILAQLLFNMSFTEATEAETEDAEYGILEDETQFESEDLTEGLTEGLSESVAELVG